MINNNIPSQLSHYHNAVVLVDVSKYYRIVVFFASVTMEVKACLFQHYISLQLCCENPRSRNLLILLPNQVEIIC